MLWTFSQKDQESRWYSMFKRLIQNFMKIRITLLTVIYGQLTTRSPSALPQWISKAPLDIYNFYLIILCRTSQCCQAENQTKKSQNQTFMRPYFYQKSDQKRTQTHYFEVKIRLVPKAYFQHKANQLLLENIPYLRKFSSNFLCFVEGWKIEHLTFCTFLAKKRTSKAKRAPI